MGDVAVQRIPFVPQQSTGLDELAGAGREAINVVMDASGSVRRRPGIVLWSTATADERGLDTIHATVQGEVYALSASPPVRQLYRITPTGADEVQGIDLVGMGRPVVAETESILVFAAGDTMTKLTFATAMTTELGGDPPKASHVVAQSSRLVANDVVTDRTKVNFSEPALGSSFAGFEVWNAVGDSGFFTAEARPDPVLALAETTNEVFVFGTTSVQVWSPDANFVFVPTATREHGLGAASSIIPIEQTFAYLDHRRRFVVGDGRGYEVISGPIQEVLDELETVADCFGFRVNLGPTDALCWTFPSDGRTFVFQKGAGWGQWQSWNSDTSTVGPFNALAAAHNPVTNETLVALRDGRVGVMQTFVTTDEGDPIVSSVTTGYLNRGSDLRKHCRNVRIALKRGNAPASSGTVAWLMYRDRPGEWESRIPVDLGTSPDTEIVLEFRSLGVYRRRQWRFEFSGTEDFVLTEASEEFQALGD